MSQRTKLQKGEGYCRKCQKIMGLYNFYEATNQIIDANGHMSVCKKCCSEIYDYYFSIYNNMEVALLNTCRDLDVLFSKIVWKQAQSHIEKLKSKGRSAEQVFGYYKSKLSSTGKHNERLDAFRFYDGETTDVLSNNEEQISDLPSQVVDFWGQVNRFGKWHYDFLENKYREYIQAYECETPVMEELFRQAAFESLEIQIKRINNEDASKHLKNLQDILTSANIKPAQESGANATDQMTYGVLIKKWENEEPIPEPDEEWKDVDGIGKYIRIWFLGHLCKILGIKNEYSEEYEAEMARLRVELPSDNTSVEDMEEGD